MSQTGLMRIDLRFPLIDFPILNYKMPGHNLIVEAAVVGATLVPVYGVVCQSVDALTGNTGDGADYSKNWMMKIALTGVVYHTLAEAYGMNDWFLRNSVAKHKEDRKKTKQMSENRKTRYNYSNYAVPQFPDADKRYPMNDPWSQGSWTSSPASANANAVEQFPVQQS